LGSWLSGMAGITEPLKPKVREFGNLMIGI
jgi:hypothetical protein